jgi:uncharacterized protein (TIGR00645 family)
VKDEAMKSLETLIEKVILASRWLLVVFYLGLAVALALYAVSFLGKLWEYATKVTELQETDAILKVLGLIDASLVASLIVMVIISGYENFVSRFNAAGDEQTELAWLGKIDSGSLKIKVASTIVAISAIHLLQVFLNTDQYDSMQMMWLVLMHLAFTFSALVLALIDWMVSAGKSAIKK